jgi:hypothetical protein
MSPSDRMSTVRTASAAIAYVQEELAKARTSTDRLKRNVAQVMNLVRGSSYRDQLFAIAGDVMYDTPKAIQDLEQSLETCAMAVNKIDYEDLRQTIRPDKVDELEAILDEVRLQIPRRTGRIPSE